MTAYRYTCFAILAPLYDPMKAVQYIFPSRKRYLTIIMSHFDIVSIVFQAVGGVIRAPRVNVNRMHHLIRTCSLCTKCQQLKAKNGFN